MNGGEGIRGGQAATLAGISSSGHRNSIIEIEGSGSDHVLQGNIATSAVTGTGGPATPSRYEAQKRRDWNTFGQYLRNHRPPLSLARCSGANVLEFLRYLDQFGKTKVHVPACPYFGLLHPPSPCSCPLRQAWGSLDALIGRLRAAYEEHGGKPETNPFGARAVRNYLREVRELQAKARGISHQKKKRKPRPGAAAAAAAAGSASASSQLMPPPAAPSTPALPPPSHPPLAPTVTSSIVHLASPSDSMSSHMLNPIHLLSVAIHDPRYPRVEGNPEDSHIRLLS